MKISIITVCFNSVDTIADTMESVASQTYSDIEHIVIDGASDDGTVEFLRAYSGHSITLVSETDAGIYDAMNKGIALANGEIVGILNSDDIFASPETIQMVVDAFVACPDAGIVFGDVLFVESADTSKIRRYYSSRRFKPWKLRFGWMPPHPATFVRKSTYQHYGDYKIDYKISSDYEMFVRWLMVRHVIYKRIDRVLVCMRHGGASTSGISSSLQLNKEIVRACVSNGIYTNLFFLAFKVPFKLLELVRRPRLENSM